jgi:membrane protein
MKKFKKRFNEFRELLLSPELRILPGNIAYMLTFSLIPILSMMIYVLITFNLSTNLITDFINSTFPVGISKLLEPIFNTNITRSSLLTILISVMIATNGCHSIIIASNTIYDFDNAPYIKRVLKSIALTLLVILMFTFILIVPLLGRSFINLAIKYIGVVTPHEKIINILFFILQGPVAILVLFFILKLLFTAAPDEAVESKYVNRGAMFTTGTWLVITYIFSYYINNFARYDAVYGNLANIVMLLFYLYLLAYTLVIGLCLNRKTTEKGIEKTNSIKLEEIRKKIKKEKEN